jgi:hypothetical protein
MSRLLPLSLEAGYGPTAIEALAKFGREALAPVVRAILSRYDRPAVVSDGLRTRRRIVEGVHRPLRFKEPLIGRVPIRLGFNAGTGRDGCA